MFDRLTARGRALLVLGAAGSVIGAGMAATAVSSSAVAGDVSLNPSATSVNLLDVHGFNDYKVKVVPQNWDYVGTWKVDINNIQGVAPRIEVIHHHSADEADTLAYGYDDGELTWGHGDHLVYKLRNFNPYFDKIEIIGDDGNGGYDAQTSTGLTADSTAFGGWHFSIGAPSSATVTFFMDVAGDGLTSDDHAAPPISMKWLDPSQLTLNLTAPASITAGDPITSALTISPSLDPSVLNKLGGEDEHDYLIASPVTNPDFYGDNHSAVRFEYFDNYNQPFTHDNNRDYGELGHDGMTFYGHSHNTWPGQSGVFSTKATLFARWLPEGSQPTTVAHTRVNDFNVGSLSLYTPDSANVRNVPENDRDRYMPTLTDTSLSDRSGCVTCTDVLVRSGTKSVTYTAVALSADDNPVPVPNVPVEFTVYGHHVDGLLANGQPLPYNGIVSVPADANGVAQLTITDPSAAAWDHYLVKALANGKHAPCDVFALYQNAKPSNVVTTPVVQAVKAGTSTTIQSTVLDQWNQPFGDPGYSVVYVDLNWYTSNIASAGGPSIAKGDNPNDLDEAGNTVFGSAQVGSNGKTAPYSIADLTFGHRYHIDGIDHIVVLLYHSQGDPWFNHLLDFVCVGSENPVDIEWLADPNPSFVRAHADHFRFDTSIYTQSVSDMFDAPHEIPIDTTMGTNWGRQRASLVRLDVSVTNGELPAQPLGGTPVTFTGPPGTLFATDPTGACLPWPIGCWGPTSDIPPYAAFKSSVTVLTDINGRAHVWATATKVGTNGFKATVGSLSDTVGEAYINLPQDVRNITLTPATSNLTSGMPQTLTVNATDIFSNPVANTPITIGETGVGRLWDGAYLTNGGHSDYEFTGADGTSLVTVATAAGETGAAVTTALVDDENINLVCKSKHLWICDWDSMWEGDGFSQVNDPAGFIYDAPVAGVAAGNSSATAIVNYAIAPTFTAPTVLAAPGVAPISGKATAGALVTLLMNNVAGPATIAGSDGSFAFSPTITKSTLFAVMASGMTAPSQLTTVLGAPSTAAAGGSTTPAGTVKLVTQRPYKPRAASPRHHVIYAQMTTNPRVTGVRVDWYLSTAKGKLGRFIGHSTTGGKGWTSITWTGAKHDGLYHVRAFVHGVTGQVSSAWSPVSGLVRT